VAVAVPPSRPARAPHASAPPAPAARAPTSARRRAALRRLVVQLHLWVGLTAGLVVSVVGVTGSLYVFAPEVTAALHADVWRVPADAPRLSDAELVRRVEAGTGARIESLQWPLRGRDVWWIKLFGRDAWVFADPRTGAVLATDRSLPAVHFFAWVLEAHTSLTLGEAGYLITGGASLLLALALVSSGLFLWWPRRRAAVRRAVTVRWRGATWRRRLYDLHNVGGAYAAAVMVVLALTGAYWSFPDASQRLVDAVTGSPRDAAFPATPAEEPRSAWSPGARPLSLAEVLAATDTLFPGHARRNLWMTADTAGVLYLSWIRNPRVAAGGEYRPMVWLDRYTGAPLRVYDPARAPLGTRVTNVWLPPVHYGEVGGLPTRVLAFAGGLAPAGLWVTGALMWWRRRRRGS
jgi:uncharacterized iron-regulated membrane protein